jgi:nitrogenase molybdenum-iron protein beta chain
LARNQPKLIGVVTTCLSETIGDDVKNIVKNLNNSMSQGASIPIVTISTPSYVGSHVTGYDNCLKALVETLTENPCNEQKGSNGKINIITGWLNPGDIWELKAMLKNLSAESIILTDISATFDAPLSLPKPKPPQGGTGVEEIRDTAKSIATIALYKDMGASAAKFLMDKYEVPAILGPLPIGITATDDFLDKVTQITGTKIPDQLRQERGRLIDAIVDANQYLFGRRVAIFGDPDLVTSLTRFISELGMEPIVLCTGTKSNEIIKDIEALNRKWGYHPDLLVGSDLYEFHQRIKINKVDLILGNSKGVDIAKEEGIPLIRVGFPVYDRLGYHRRSIIGYKGGINLVDLIANTILEYEYHEARLHQ